MKDKEALLDHKNEIRTMTSFPIPGMNERMTRTRRAATAAGNEQYPIKQMHCIKDKEPPSKEEFIVMIRLPIHMIIKTVEKTSPEALGEVKQRMLIRNYYSKLRSKKETDDKRTP